MTGMDWVWVCLVLVGMTIVAVGFVHGQVVRLTRLVRDLSVMVNSLAAASVDQAALTDHRLYEIERRVRGVGGCDRSAP